MTASQVSATRSGLWQFWIDRGGTFTDIVAQRPDGHLLTHKLLSENPQRYTDAPLQGIRDLMGLGPAEPIPADQIALIKMGTTVATNALLERQGEPTVLLITAGFGDALAIGYQNRPDIFALRIQKPECLYDRVIEVPERLSAQGDVLIPLDLATVEPALRQAYAAGFRSCAIVLVHSYAYPDHEQKLADLARSIGFSQISASHAVSPLIKLISRGDTTVVDAYLSPVLRRYVDRVTAGLGGRQSSDRSAAGSSVAASSVADSSAKGIEIKAPKLLFMQSNGGLTAAEAFQGKDSLLSGPAGGLVGAVQVCRSAGFERIITFDMGGTSTDVAHYGGVYERQWETELAGVRLRAPILDIHTVAAGGGSILRFEADRLQVGPASAGAYPGPAAYGQGGPLTVTDANVQLGYLQPQFFPKVFGSDGQQPLDRAIVQEKFQDLAAQIQAGTQIPQTAEVVAAGFRSIALENMANAIQKISVQRGYDLSDYVLCCFGAAGGQHACALAQRLGMGQILVHPYSGILSAYGMGVADRRILKEKSLEIPFEAENISIIGQFLGDLATQGHGELEAQGIPDVVAIDRHLRLHLRYAGSDSTLTVTWPELGKLVENPSLILETLTQDFQQQHQQRYGFMLPEKPLVVAMAEAEIVGRTGVLAQGNPVAAQEGAPEVAAIVSCFFGGIWQDTPVYQRQSLGAGWELAGPALIIEPTGTNVIEPGWRSIVTEQGNLLLCPVRSEQGDGLGAQSRQGMGSIVPPNAGVLSPLPQFASNRGRDLDSDPPLSADPVFLEIFNNRLMSIAEQMGFTLQNTSHSVNIKERLDFSCAIFDAAGQLVANAPHIPVHLGSMGEAIQALRQHHGAALPPGTVYVSNNPYNGGTHLPDITVITPVFLPASSETLDPKTRRKPDFYVASRGHHADIGGITPGSMPAQSQTLGEEGILLDNTVLVRAGVFQTEALRRILTRGEHPARNPEQNLADLQAQVAANGRGARELLKLVQQYGWEQVNAYLGYVQDNGEQAVRGAIDRLIQAHRPRELAEPRNLPEQGELPETQELLETQELPEKLELPVFRLEMDSGAWIQVKITLNPIDRSAILDFSGTAPQQPSNINAPLAVCKAVVLYVFRTLVSEPIPLNAGCLRPLTLIVPSGCLLNPRPPAAVVAGNVETSQALADALYGALGVLAASQGTMNNLTFGNDRHQYYETLCGGSGAGPGFPGCDAVQTHMTNSRLTDPEVLEQRFPVRLLAFRIRQGSGGAGRYPGGCGTVRRLQFQETLTVNLLSDRRRVAPFGLQGGEAGSLGVNQIERNPGPEPVQSIERLTRPPGPIDSLGTARTGTEIIAGTATVVVYPGDILTIATPGGGGFGANSPEKFQPLADAFIFDIRNSEVEIGYLD